jgi:hypothetical protein
MIKGDTLRVLFFLSRLKHSFVVFDTPGVQSWLQESWSHDNKFENKLKRSRSLVVGQMSEIERNQMC